MPDQKINYDQLFEQILNKNKDARVLLHCCCAPCATQSLFRLKGVKTLAYFYNPNIMPIEEYNLRKENLIKLCNSLGIDYFIDEYDNQTYLNLVSGKEHLLEGGERCELCFYLRLYSAAKFAKQNEFDYFCTTLTLSPHKNSNLINEIGYRIEKELGIKYLPSDFKKQNGYQNSIQLSKEYNLYRQNYCGCKFL